MDKKVYANFMIHSTSIIGKRCANFEEIKAQTNQIIDKFAPEKIILFGSYAFGKQTPESDVDLLIIVNSNKSLWALSSEISLALDHSFPIDILVKTQKQITKRLQWGDFFLKDIINSGKVLYERNSKRMDQ